MRQRPILVVEDNSDHRELIQLILEQQLGRETTWAADGIQAMQMVEKEKPSLVVLDADLPRLDGLHFARWLKSNPATRDTPVIMLTVTDVTRLEAKRAGCDEYLEKPFDVDQLVAMVRRYLSGPRPTAVAA